MIRGQSPIARDNAAGAGVGILIRVQFDRQAIAPRPIEQTANLGAGETDGIAETVDGIDQTFADVCRQDPLDQKIDVIIGAPTVFRANAVGTQERQMRG